MRQRLRLVVVVLLLAAAFIAAIYGTAYLVGYFDAPNQSERS